MHDPRLGRFFAIDPLAPKYPHNSPYAFSENVVINAVELEGLEKVLVNKLPKAYTLTFMPSTTTDIAFTRFHASFSFNTETKAYDLIFNIERYRTSYFKIPVNDKTIEQENQGITLFVETHEEVHEERMIDAAEKQYHFEFNYEGQSIEMDGTIPELMTKASDKIYELAKEKLKRIENEINSKYSPLLKNNVGNVEKITELKKKAQTEYDIKYNQINDDITRKRNEITTSLLEMLSDESSKMNEHDGPNGVNQETLNRLPPDSDSYKYQEGTKTIKIQNENIQNIDSN